MEDLHNNICQSCKKNLASRKFIAPQITIPAGRGSTGVAALASAPFWRRVFQGRQRPRPAVDNVLSIGLSRSQAASPNTIKSPPVPSAPAIDPEDISSPKQKYEPPKWSVAYNPDVERALDLHLAHTFKYDSPANCVKMSPDGQKLAVGLRDNGKTYLCELRTGSNIWLVSLVFNSIWIDTTDPSVFFDQYVKDPIDILSVQFSPDGRLIATGASDGQIRVCSFTMRTLSNFILFFLDMGYHRETNASHAERTRKHSLCRRLFS